MTEGQVTFLISVLVGAIGFLLVFIVQRIFMKIDELQKSFNDGMINILQTITAGDNSLHARVTEIDRRVTRIEARCSAEHDRRS